MIVKIIVVAILAFAVLGLIGWMVYQFVTAPAGYENEDGWNPGEPGVIPTTGKRKGG